MKKRMPGKFAHLCAILLTFCLVLTLLASLWSWQAVRLLTDSNMHHTVAGDDAVIDAQMERINAVIESTAEAQHFDPATIQALVTREDVRAFSLQCADWWLGLLQQEPVLTAPEWDTQAMEDAVREDELFRENVRATLRRSVARDDVAYPIAQTIQETVLPLRTQLISFVLPEVLERVDVPMLVTFLQKAPLICLGASAVLALLILLCMCRMPSKGGLYIGAAMGACALITLLLMLGILLLDPAAMIAQANTLLSLQLTLLLKQMALKPLIVSIAMLVISAALTALHQKRVRQRIAGSIAA